MTGTFAKILDLGEALHDLARDQAAWSQATFGADETRDGVGALKHLAKEAAEAEEVALALREFSTAQPGHAEAKAELRTELADCLLLILDASRRSGVPPLDLIRAAQTKMEVNKSRKWPAPEADTPVEHIR